MLAVYAQLALIVTMKEHQYQLLVTQVTSALKAQPSLCPVPAVHTTERRACMTLEAALPVTLVITVLSLVR